MIKKSITGIAFFMHVAMAVAVAQHHITVSVTEASNDKPMPGASIQLEGTIYQGKADAIGLATIRHIKEGSYTVVVSHLGYKTEKQHVTITGDQRVEIALQRAALLT